MLKKILKITLIFIGLMFVAEIGLQLNSNLKSKNDFDKFRNDLDQVDEYEILILGDSVSAGYPKILATKLKNKFKKKINVYNFAQPYARNIDLVNSLNRGVNHKIPDIVILMVGAEINSQLQYEESHNSFLTNLYLGRFALKYIDDLKLKVWQIGPEETDYQLSGSNESYYRQLIEDRSYNYFLSLDQLNELNRKLDTENLADPFSLELKVLVLTYLNDFKNAEFYLNKIKTERKKLLLGYLYERKGLYVEARSIYLDLLKEDPIICIDIARVSTMMKSFSQASLILNQCLSKVRDSGGRVKILNSLVQTEMGGGNIAVASKYMTDVLKIIKSEKIVNWESYLNYSNLLLMDTKNDESIEFLTKALEVNPNNLTVLKNYFDAVLYRMKNKDQAINFLSHILDISIHKNEINKFVNFYLSPIVDNYNLNLNPRSIFLKSLLVGNHETVNNSFLSIKNDNKTKLNWAEVQRIKNFYSNIKKLNSKLLLMQIPNQKIDVLKNELGTSNDVIFIDTYKYFRELVESKKYNASDLFMNDGKHLTSKGDNEISDLLLSQLKVLFK